MDTIKVVEEKRAIEIIAEFNVYTDRLLDEGTGVVITRVYPTSLKIVKTIRRRGACFTCSYEEEKRALEELVHWLQNLQ